MIDIGPNLAGTICIVATVISIAVTIIVVAIATKGE